MSSFPWNLSGWIQYCSFRLRQCTAWNTCSFWQDRFTWNNRRCHSNSMSHYVNATDHSECRLSHAVHSRISRLFGTIWHTDTPSLSNELKRRLPLSGEDPHATCSTLKVKIGGGISRLRYSVDRTRLERYANRESRKYINEFDQSCSRTLSRWCGRLITSPPWWHRAREIRT